MFDYSQILIHVLEMGKPGTALIDGPITCNNQGPYPEDQVKANWERFENAACLFFCQV